MAKARESSKVNAKTSKHKVNRSQEYVVDSSDEDAAPEDRSVKKVNKTVAPAKEKDKTAKPIAQKIEELSSSSSEDESSSTEEKHTVRKAKSTEMKKASSGSGAKTATVKKEIESESSSSEEETSSEEDSSEEESSSEDENPAAAQAAPKANGVKRKADEQSSDPSESDSTSESEDGPAAKKSKHTESSGASDSEADADDLPSDPLSAKPAHPSTSNATSQSKPNSAFLPPAGYSPIPTDLPPLLQPKNLAGKQVWHIVCPAGLPLDSLLPPKSSLSTHTISRDGRTYDIVEKPSSSHQNHTLFLPSTASKEVIYHPTDLPITRSFQIEQRIVLPNLFSSQSAGKKPVHGSEQPTRRPQPKDLKMRYKPPGFGAGRLGRVGTPDAESEEFSEPEIEGRKKVFRPRAQTDGKAKKKKKTDHEREAVNGDVEMDDATAATTAKEVEGKEKKSKKKPRQEPGDGDVEMVDAATPTKGKKEKKEKGKKDKKIKQES